MTGEGDNSVVCPGSRLVFAEEHKMMGYYGGFGLLGGLGMGAMMVLWVVLIGLTIWAVIRLFEGRNLQTVQAPLDTLKLRYARGEIDATEFERAKQTLV
ncbi:MAG: SHOCT domain-containing protein [Chloroflexota bacterium]